MPDRNTPRFTESTPALLLVTRDILFLYPVFTAASGSSLQELSLQVENKQSNKFSRGICAFPYVLLAEWKEKKTKNLTQDIWGLGDKLRFAHCYRALGCPVDA